VFVVIVTYRSLIRDVCQVWFHGRSKIVFRGLDHDSWRGVAI
jgi:hypothetical protein